MAESNLNKLYDLTNDTCFELFADNTLVFSLLFFHTQKLGQEY